jgi:hypothetical protein
MWRVLPFDAGGRGSAVYHILTPSVLMCDAANTGALLAAALNARARAVALAAIAAEHNRGRPRSMTAPVPLPSDYAPECEAMATSMWRPPSVKRAESSLLTAR